jgi:predicted amino acid dehydrogenase
LRRTAETIVSALMRHDPQHDDGPFAERVRAAGRRNGRGLDQITAELVKSADIVIGVDAAAMLPTCDVVVSATSSAHGILRSDSFKTGAVVCDVSRPRNVVGDIRTERPDVLAFEGGLVEVPQCSDLGWRFGLPAGVAFACMCEPMILALEGQFDAAPRGAGVFVDYIDKLRLWGERNGFRLADLRSFDRTITEADWQDLRKARTLRGASRAHAAVLGHVRS